VLNSRALFITRGELRSTIAIEKDLDVSDGKFLTYHALEPLMGGVPILTPRNMLPDSSVVRQPQLFSRPVARQAKQTIHGHRGSWRRDPAART
jgi:hypothetical protein